MIGVFGGSGFYELLDNSRTVSVETPYGPPSASPLIGTIDDTDVAFIPRHGIRHEYPPHAVPYRANLWALHHLGVDRIVGPSAVGSIHPPFAPGHLVVPDQLVDRTWGRQHTFSEGPEVQHIAFADPYCPELRPLAVSAAVSVGAEVHSSGTTVVVQGPRFSTRAESTWFASNGWHLLNMTQLPEASLARELGICYVNIAVVTDYDVGVPGAIEPVTHQEVLAKFGETLHVLRSVIYRLIPEMSRTHRLCSCSKAAQ